jgi:hypothetical protein
MPAPNSVNPFFTVTPDNRSLPHVFVDQALQSLPLLYPNDVLLLQRRYSELGGVVYSLLVYRKDAAAQDVTVEGVAVHDMRAWLFTAHCSSNTVLDGLVSTLEQIAALVGKEKK